MATLARLTGDDIPMLGRGEPFGGWHESQSCNRGQPAPDRFGPHIRARSGNPLGPIKWHASTMVLTG